MNRLKLEKTNGEYVLSVLGGKEVVEDVQLCLDEDEARWLLDKLFKEVRGVDLAPSRDALEEQRRQWRKQLYLMKNV